MPENYDEQPDDEQPDDEQRDVEQPAESSESVDLTAELGAEGGVSIQTFSVFIPDRDQREIEIGNQRQWVLEALRLLGEINGGATAMPPCEGTWLNTENELIQEHPVIVYSYVTDEFLSRLAQIREFLHRMGRETNQGEVAFEFDNRFYRIQRFDSPPEQTDDQQTDDQQTQPLLRAE